MLERDYSVNGILNNSIMSQKYAKSLKKEQFLTK